MPIKIEEVSAGVYRCSLERGGRTVWATSGMSEEHLIQNLRDLGCHVTDIGDAFEAAEPGWTERHTSGS